MNSPDGTMRAMRASGPKPASLSLDRVPIPSPGSGEVLVRVAATAVTAQELTWPEQWPVIPCHDLSGVVAGSGPSDMGGPDGTGWADGTEVFGLVGFDRPGAAAEYVTIPAADLAAKPAVIDQVAAAAIPLGGLTAWQALHDHAGLRPGQHVLVHGGAGGVGAYAVQVAAAHGAQVTATASARDAAYVADLGAHQVIDYTGRFEDQVRDVDVVIDPVGGDTMARSWPVLRAGGILIAIAEEPPEDHGGRDDVRARFFVVEPSGAQLGQLAELIHGGKLRAAVSATFGLSDLREAFAAQRTRGHPGKVVITV
jgi:NADPH:quinone reductase-like Zn-dependent oxidoreductase